MKRIVFFVYTFLLASVLAHANPHNSVLDLEGRNMLTPEVRAGANKVFFDTKNFSQKRSLTLLTKDGGRVSWYHGDLHDLIAFDAIVNDKNKNTELFLMKSDGTNRTCVTCDLNIRKGFIGNPSWHPDGEHLVIQVENDASKHRVMEHLAFGINNDLWIVSKDGKNLKRIWKSKLNGAVLHPHFSPDGKTLIFAERVATGKPIVRKPLSRICPTPGCENHWDGWQIRVAQFDSEKMEIVSSYTIQPNGIGFYETNDFQNNETFTYSFTRNGQAYVDDLFSVKKDGSDMVHLLNSPTTWDEHGKYSPDGKYLVFQSSRIDETWIYPKSRAYSLSTELYLKNVETGEVRQLTNMNERDDYNRFLVSDYDWSKGGSQIIFQVAPMNNRGSQVHPEIWLMKIDEWDTAASSGDYTYKLKYGGLERKYYVHVPTSYDKSKMPVVMVFHGGGGTVDSIKRQTGFDAQSEKDNFIVVYPEGTGVTVWGKIVGTWNADKCCGFAKKNNIDDVGFVKEIIKDLSKKFNIDQTRLYATGHSNGALFSYRLACEASDVFAAIAANAGHDSMTKCDPEQSIPIMHVHGTGDPAMPYEGGTSCSPRSGNYPCVSVPKYLDTWAVMNGCSETTTSLYANGAVSCVTYDSCPTDGETVLCSVDGAGHTWPGGSYVKDGLLWKKSVGLLSNDMSATEMMVDFFFRHKKDPEKTFLELVSTGVSEHTITVNDTIRHYRMYATNSDMEGRPLLLVLHGGGMSSAIIEQEHETTGNALREIADQYKVLLVVPNGTNMKTGAYDSDKARWNDDRIKDGPASNGPIVDAVDDVSFLSQLVDYIHDTYGTDRSRTYVMGPSNGGYMTQKMLINAPELFAAGAALISSVSIPMLDNSPQQPKPILFWHGTGDTLVWYNGVPNSILSAISSVEWWADVNHATANMQPVPITSPDENGCYTTFQSYQGEAPVYHYVSHGGGHIMPSKSHNLNQWPLVYRFVRAKYGEQCADIDSYSFVWDFLRQFYL